MERENKTRSIYLVNRLGARSPVERQCPPRASPQASMQRSHVRLGRSVPPQIPSEKERKKEKWRTRRGSQSSSEMEA